MSLSTEQQILEQIKGCQAALIVLPEKPSTDSIAAALALQNEINKQEKKVSVVSWKFDKPDKLSFMKNIDSITDDIDLLQKCIIQVDTSKYPLADLSYHKQGEMLQVYLTPKKGSLPKEAIEIKHAAHTYDLIIAINTSELPALGQLYTQYKFFFDQTPIINIDHRPDNEQYGQINWIDINTTSTSEMIYEMFYKNTPPSKDIASILMAGIMEETHSFRTHQTNPATLQTVSKLLNAGADHDTVVDKLYRSKTVGLLRLWGHVLDNLQADRELSLAWSVIPQSVFASTGTNNHNLQDLMNEILSHSPEAKTVVLLLEQDQSVEIQISTVPPLHAKDLIKNWQPYGSERIAVATINKPLAEVEKEVISAVKQRLASVLR